MRSLEALSILDRRIHGNEEIIGDDYLDFIHDIEKDLKILEIVKLHKLLNYIVKNEVMARLYGLDKEELEILKEFVNEH